MSCDNMCLRITLLILAITYSKPVTAYLKPKSFQCGAYGFVCEGKNRLKLCDDSKLLGPAFLCPPDTICNEESVDVCENTINYIDPAITRTINCRRNERIADPTVPGCKGYILCIPNKNRFQGIKFKCSGNTVFNGFTRTCSSPNKYKCPLPNATNSNYLGGGNRRISNHDYGYENSGLQHTTRPIDCKNYNFRVTADRNPVQATYFCPSLPIKRGDPIRCTVFSNQYCLTLERYDEDQFIQHTGAAYRRPRKPNLPKS